MGCTDRETSVGPASTSPTSEEVVIVVGIDVDKRSHTPALLDERGGVIGTLSLPTAPKERGDEQPPDPAGLSASMRPARHRAPPARHAVARSLAVAGYVVLMSAPAGRIGAAPARPTPADAIAVAQVVLRARRELGSALEPEPVRALALPSCAAPPRP